jgi:hypothetical protein
MATIKSEYYRFNGSTWDLHYFKTSADLIVETQTKKVMTDLERQAIADYLTAFNDVDLLAKVQSNGKLPVAIIPSLGYLPLSGGSLTGDLNAQRISMSGNLIVGGTTFINGIIGSDNASIQFSSGLDAINFNGVPLINVGAPFNASDAATKEYVDGLVAAGMRPVAAVKVATTANVTLSGLTTHDGYTLVAGDRILVWKQTITADNGIYTVSSGAWSKVAADSKQGAFVFVENGTLYNDWFFHCQDNAGTWIDHSRPDTIKAGVGLVKSGTTIRIKNNTDDGAGGITNDMLAGSIDVTKIDDFVLSNWAGNAAWTDISLPSETGTVKDRLTDIAAAIRLLRGTTNYNTNNTETIAGAYALANTKIKTYVNSATPVADANTYKTGDLYFKTLA